MASLASMGMEGIVSKRRSSRYGSPGGWTKTKFRETLEGFIGAVIGPLDRPEALIVGTITDTGNLVVLGRTTPLSPAQAADLGVLLRPPVQPHPWPPNGRRPLRRRPGSHHPRRTRTSCRSQR
jgi:hypothetical protein